MGATLAKCIGPRLAILAFPGVEEELGEVARAGDAVALREVLDRCTAGKEAVGWAGSYAAVNTADANGCTPLYHACVTGHSKCVKLCLRYGANVDAASHDGSTALLAACSNGHAECARLCLDAGALPNRADQSGKTPTMAARDRSAIPDGNGPHLIELLLATSAEQRAHLRELHAADWNRPRGLFVCFCRGPNFHQGR